MAQLRGGRTRRDPYLRIERTVVEDSTLSALAKLTLAWLLDKTTYPGGWETDVPRIAAIMSEGIYAIRTALDDLEHRGYLQRVDTGRGGRGVRGEWWVTDDPAIPAIESEVSAEQPAVNRASRSAANRVEPRDGSRSHLFIERLTKETDNATDARARTDAEFDVFWNDYPRKVARPTALRAFTKARATAAFDTIMAGLNNWSQYWAARNESEFVPHPATWLNQQRWNDMPPRSVPKSSMAKFNAAVAAEQQFITTTATEELHDTQRDERSDPHSHRVLRGATPTTEVG